ncbi:MAG: transaminase [Candidatus Geothermincolales bacterium]
MARVSLDRVRELRDREAKRYRDERPKSLELYRRARKSLAGGVPMSWMRIWPGGFPVFVKRARGSRVWDVDGHEYVDFCLGDTGALCGHGNPEVAEAVSRQAREGGLTTLLPTEDAIWVGEELARRFGLPCWQILMTASDANRMALKMAREFTGKRLTLAFNGSYHGTVDETLCVEIMGYLVPIPGMMGPLITDPSTTTRVIEFNDVDALEKALTPGDVACVITEPVLTNVGIIHPEPGFHQALRELTRKHGALLLLDETHSMCAGPRGVTGEMGLEPDILTVGKFIAGGYPAAALGFTADLGGWLEKRLPWHNFFGFGGTLSGNPTAVAAMRAALEHVLTEENFERMKSLAGRMENGLSSIIEENGLDWYVARIGCRVEFRFLPRPPRNGGEALFTEVPYNAVDVVSEGLTGPLDELVHLYCANRGILLTPVHEMALVGPDTTPGDVEHYLEVIGELVRELVA